ncbi:hypothetical protein F5878DRAFT_549093, partial [Lentinula raphanica]
MAVRSRSLNQPVDLKTWHRRLGHIGMSRLLMMIKKDLVDGLVVVGPINEDLEKCNSCHLGKAKRRPFDAITTRETRLLERVHVDLTGPMRVRAIGGYYYSMPIVDGHSAMGRDFYLANKEADTTLTAMKSYKARAENET